MNQDRSSAQLAALRAQVQELKLELQELRSERLRDLSSKVTMLKADIAK